MTFVEYIWGKIFFSLYLTSRKHFKIFHFQNWEQFYTSRVSYIIFPVDLFKGFFLLDTETEIFRKKRLNPYPANVDNMVSSYQR